MKYCILLATAVAAMEEDTMKVMIPGVENAWFSGMLSGNDRIEFTYSIPKNRYIAIQFSDPRNYTDGDKQRPSTRGDSIIFKANNDRAEAFDLESNVDHAPSDRKDRDNGGQNSLEGFTSKKVDDKYFTGTFKRKLDTGDGKDVKFECMEDAKWKTFNWFSKDSDNWDDKYTATGTYVMRFKKDGDNCEFNLQTEASAFRVLASAAAVTSAYIVSTL